MELQGSCLGPLLFLVFINDLHRNLNHCNDIQFADDTTIYKGHRSMRYLKWCIEMDMQNISDWFKANKLTLNISKSVYMIFSRKNHTDIDLKLGDNKLPKVTTTKFLGMWIDQNLNWNEHLSKLKTKVKRNLTLLKIGQRYLNTHTKKMLYYAQIYSHLSYGLILWGNMVSNTQLTSIQKLQNQARPNQHNTETSYKTLGIMKLHEAIKMENCKMMHKLEHNNLPGKLPLLFMTDNKGKSLQKTHRYDTRTKNIPKPPKTHTKLYRNSFLTNALLTIRLYLKKLEKLP